MDNRSLLRFTVYAGIDKAGEGSSPNRVKPVRILDSPQKEEFFFGMPVEGSGRDVLSRRYDWAGAESRRFRSAFTNLSGFYRYRIKDVIKVLGYEGESPKITFSYRKSQLLDLAGDKITESMMDEAIRRTGDELGVNIIDYCVYPNRDVSPSHYEFLIEPGAPLDPSKCDEYRRILEKRLGEVNPVYKECIDTDEIAHGILYLQQMQTHALWRDVKLHKGTSLNQVKPVRVLDTTMKKDFFYGLLEK